MLKNQQISSAQKQSTIAQLGKISVKKEKRKPSEYNLFLKGKRLYSLGLRFSFLTDFLPSCAIVDSCWAMVLCCFLSISECDFIVLLKSLNNVLWLFSSVARLVFSFFMSARMDFGIPDVFGMAIC